MFSHSKNLLCAAALAGAALAQQDLCITLPTSGTIVTPDQMVTVQVERTLPSYGEPVAQVGLVIAVSPCPGVCTDPEDYLGYVLYSGPFTPQPPNADCGYQNFSVTTPDWFDGPAQIIAALFSMKGAYSTPELQFATTDITVRDSMG